MKHRLLALDIVIDTLQANNLIVLVISENIACSNSVSDRDSSKSDGQQALMYLSVRLNIRFLIDSRSLSSYFWEYLLSITCNCNLFLCPLPCESSSSILSIFQSRNVGLTRNWGHPFEMQSLRKIVPLCLERLEVQIQ